ncbi:hypothetical protein [uncultured virus]|uniref:Uncharacterized protein n=1 Tax=uncultured virus TaxID=340016 RepID=A0A218MKQ9_9VIRU|nr:hypothetical protein [uncultured virus]
MKNIKNTDVINQGDGLPDWMQFTITLLMFGLFSWVLYLLFHPTLVLDEKHRDLLNILLGGFIAMFGKVIDFWFKQGNKKQGEIKNEK